jgi:hypothetical protein
MKAEKYFYYLRDKEKKPRVTVCIIGVTFDKVTKYARGIAICSLKDPVVKVTGRNIAHGRAVSALMNNNKSNDITRIEADMILESCGEEGLFIYKSEMNPVLTEHELTLIEDFEGDE